jgi:hypothetical protein
MRLAMPPSRCRMENCLCDFSHHSFAIFNHSELWGNLKLAKIPIFRAENSSIFSSLLARFVLEMETTCRFSFWASITQCSADKECARESDIFLIFYDKLTSLRWLTIVSRPFGRTVDWFWAPWRFGREVNLSPKCPQNRMDFVEEC